MKRELICRSSPCTRTQAARVTDSRSPGTFSRRRSLIPRNSRAGLVAQRPSRHSQPTMVASGAVSRREPELGAAMTARRRVRNRDAPRARGRAGAVRMDGAPLVIAPGLGRHRLRLKLEELRETLARSAAIQSLGRPPPPRRHPFPDGRSWPGLLSRRETRRAPRTHGARTGPDSP
jgi:hypothetical protein